MVVTLPGDEVSSAVIIACVLEVGCVETVFPVDPPEISFAADVALATLTIAADEHPFVGFPSPFIGAIVIT